MALFDNGLKLGAGLAIGIGALIVAPAVIPALGAMLKPVARAAIKSGLICIEKTRELIAEAQETIEDIAAEVQAQMASERQGANPVVESTDL